MNHTRIKHQPFSPWEWLASNFSLLHHLWIKNESHENRGGDHQLKQLLIVKQILLVSLIENVWRTVWRKCILMFGYKMLRLREYRKWSPTKEAPDCYTNSPCWYIKKCIKNIMENIPTDVVVRRVKVIILLPWLSLTGMVSLCEVSPFSAVSPLMPLCWSALERGSWMTGWNTVPWKMKKERCGMVKNESQVKLFQNYWNSFLLGPR